MQRRAGVGTAGSGSSDQDKSEEQSFNLAISEASEGTSKIIKIGRRRVRHPSRDVLEEGKEAEMTNKPAGPSEEGLHATIQGAGSNYQGQACCQGTPEGRRIIEGVKDGLLEASIVRSTADGGQERSKIPKRGARPPANETTSENRQKTQKHEALNQTAYHKKKTKAQKHTTKSQLEGLFLPSTSGNGYGNLQDLGKMNLPCTSAKTFEKNETRDPAYAG